MGDQQRLVVVFGGCLGDQLGRGGVAPLDREAGDFCAVGFGDRGEAVAEGADGDGEHIVADGERAGDGGFERAGAAGGDQQDFLVGAEEGLDAAGDALEQGGELRAAVVDHFAGRGGQHVGRAGRGTGDTQVGHPNRLS